VAESGRRKGLKIPRSLVAVRVQFSSRAPRIQGVYCYKMDPFLIRTYLKNNLSAHGCVVHGSKCIAHPAFSGTPLFNRLGAPDSRDFAKLNLLFLNPNLIFEIDSKFIISNDILLLILNLKSGIEILEKRIAGERKACLNVFF
jgi:hypothetical protein